MENAIKRPRGRPRGLTAQGMDVRRRLYRTSLRLIAQRGYERTTLRDVAQHAGVSVGLLYRYFPSKRSVLMALYEELSIEYASRAAVMPAGRWRDRAVFALETSLEVLRPHRRALTALLPVLVGDPAEGLFAPATAFSRARVQEVFVEAVRGATDAPPVKAVASLGRLLYVAHLAVLLWWLLDKSPDQTATKGLLTLIRRTMPRLALAWRLPFARSLALTADDLLRQALAG
jgi:AcrR family transcriptional regulator